MIGSIDNKADIDLYLEAKEVKELSIKRLKGVLIKIHKPKRQGTIYISVNDKRKHENGPNGIGIDDNRYWGLSNDFSVEVFLGTEWYQELQERGKTGTRHSMRDGAKISIYDRSMLKRFDTSTVERLEFYRDNKDKLRPELG